MNENPIAIVGAGIGGLVTALALHHAGIACVIIERSPSPRLDGAGIQLSPNATSVLIDLGLGGMIAEAARPIHRDLRSWNTNRLIGRVELGAAAEARYGAPYCLLRRSDLTTYLHDALASRLGPDAVRFGRDVVGLDEEADVVVLRLADSTRLRCAAVIGADGLNSAVRGYLTRDKVRLSGYVAHRALIPTDRLPWLAAPARVVIWLGPDRHCVCYPIDGGRTVNVVAVTRTEPPLTAAVRDAVVTAYAGWHPNVRTILAIADEFTSTVLRDRPAAARWHSGRVAIVGDAAHPMLPLLAQGAAMAIEDAAAVVASWVETGGFTRYEGVRRPRVDTVVSRATDALRTHHLPDGPEQLARDTMLARAGLAGQDWLYSLTQPVVSRLGT